MVTLTEEARSPVTGGIIRQQKGDASSLLALSERVRTDPLGRIIWRPCPEGRRVGSGEEQDLEALSDPMRPHPSLLNMQIGDIVFLLGVM